MPTKYKARNDIAVIKYHANDDHDAGDEIEWDLLLNPSEQLCRVDPLEKLRVEQGHLLSHLASQLLTVCDLDCVVGIAHFVSGCFDFWIV